MSKASRTLAVAALLGLASCVQLPEPGQAPQRYLLEPAAEEGETAAIPTRSLVVARPQMAPYLSGDKIAVVHDGRRLDHFAGARWAAPLPELLRAFWRESLQRRYGLTDWGTPDARYTLQMVVRNLQAEYQGADGPPRLRVTLVAGLRDRRSGELLARSRQSRTAVASADRLDAIVAGLEGLLDETSAALFDELWDAAPAPDTED
jgi:ABC-type uncharacterized transport system auxiliary subunit